MGLTKTTLVAAVVEGEELADSRQTKKLEACSRPPVAHTREAAAQKETVEGGR